MTRPLLVFDRSAPAESRPSNLRLALQWVIAEGPVSRADIARGTGLNPTTVSSLVKELLDDGLIEEVGHAASTGGKPARQLAVRAGARSIVAVDLSSTPASASRLNLAGDIVDRVVSTSPGSRGGAAVEAGIVMAEELVRGASAPVIGIGIVSPGVVSPTGDVIHSVNRDWSGVPVGRIFNEQLQLPSYVLNDHQAAALVEYGSNGREAGNLAVVLIGEGVGAGLILNGRLFRGDRSGAGELGHMRSPLAGTNDCACGSFGCLETIVALPAIVRAARAGGCDVPEGIAGWGPVVAAAGDGDRSAVLAIRGAGEALGQQLAEVVKLLDLHQMVLVGDIRHAGDLFLEPARAELAAQEGWPEMSKVQVSFGSAKEDVLMHGAAALVLNAAFGVLWV